MASAGPRENEKIDDWVNQMDEILRVVALRVWNGPDDSGADA
jgi:hypothetical protein